MGGKKTIMPNDVFAALRDHEFESFLPRVEAEVNKYNEIQCDKRNSYRRRVKADKPPAGDATNGKDGEDADDATISSGSAARGAINGSTTNGEAERPSKKARTEPGDDIDEGEQDGEDAEEDGGEDATEEDDEDDEESGDEAEDDDDEMDGADEEADGRLGDEDEDDGMMANGIRDEALDEPDSD